MLWGRYREYRRSFCFTSVLGTLAFALREIFKIIHHSSLFVWVLSESWRHSRALLLTDPLRKAISLTAFKCDPIGFLDHSLCGQKYFLIHCRHFFKAGTRRVRPNCTGKGLFGKKNCRVQWTLQYHGSIALVWFLPAPFSCACLVMQVRKNSVLLHTFDLSIQVERGSALLWLQIPMLHLWNHQ